MMNRSKGTVSGFILVYYLYLLPSLTLETLGLLSGEVGSLDSLTGVLNLVGFTVFVFIPVFNWYFYIKSLLEIPQEKIYLVPELPELDLLELSLIILMIWAAVGVVIAIVIYSAIRDKQRRAVRAQKKKEEEVRLRHHQENQRSYRTSIMNLCETSISLFESMPEHLRSAEKYLDQAEVEFADDAFAPFWDCIEKAAKVLGDFDEGVRLIKDYSSRYTELIRVYESQPHPFPLARQSVAKLGMGTATAERMKAVVRTAQRNFQFATIYEQRRTNKILIAGFTNLAEALDQMTWQITTSIDNLADSVETMTSTLSKSMHAIHSRMGDIAERTKQHHDEFMKEASERATRERKVLEMLDNIQRGRRPFP